MEHFEIVVHRGITDKAPENTIAAFQRAIDLGADAVELDVRLTSDKIPVVYHYYYLDEITSSAGPFFNYSFEQLKNVSIYHHNDHTSTGHISSLSEILETFTGKIGFEIEIKGPEPEAAVIIGEVLNRYKSWWQTFEVTSFEPALLLGIQSICPDIAADLLFPRSDCWMKADVVQYESIHLSRLAHARAIHLHPSQLNESIINALQRIETEIHCWDVNDIESLEKIKCFGIPRICTDNFELANGFRKRCS